MVKGSGYRPYVAREPSLAAIRGAFLLQPFLCVEETDKTGGKKKKKTTGEKTPTDKQSTSWWEAWSGDLVVAGCLVLPAILVVGWALRNMFAFRVPQVCAGADSMCSMDTLFLLSFFPMCDARSPSSPPATSSLDGKRTCATAAVRMT
jgi:hypothetical protein